MSDEQPKSEGEIRARINSEIALLAREIVERNEVFPFPGINPEAYSELKETDEKYPGYSTPIDEIISKCQTEGIKVFFGRNPDDGNVFVAPASTNFVKDCLFPRHLQITEGMDEGLKQLILKNREKNLLCSNKKAPVEF